MNDIQCQFWSLLRQLSNILLRHVAGDPRRVIILGDVCGIAKPTPVRGFCSNARERAEDTGDQIMYVLLTRPTEK